MSDRHLPMIAPLTARSVAISTLLGYHPPALPVRTLVTVGGLLGIADRAMRTALTRMVADGDVVADGGVYRLTERLLRRQVDQDELVSPRTTDWDGTWEMAVVTAAARSLPERVALRRVMVGRRLAELREGVWMRPANLLRRADGTVTDQCTLFACRHPDDAVLSRTLWDLPAWAAESRRLHDELDRTDDLAAGFMLIARVYRHLKLDPCLPRELIPTGWPAEHLRARHATYLDVYSRRLREFGDT